MIKNYVDFDGDEGYTFSGFYVFDVKVNYKKEYKEKSQNNIDARRRLSGIHESTVDLVFFVIFIALLNLLPILTEMNDTQLLSGSSYLAEPQISPTSSG